jgi:HEAT repeat protein
MNESIDPSTEDLLRALEGNDAEAAIAAAGALAGRDGDEVASRLLAVLRATDDGGVRNAVALALGDRGDPRALPAIVELVQDPRTEGNRGTLLHALRGLDCAPIFPLLLDLVLEGSFEVSREALTLLSRVDADFDEEVADGYVEKLKQALAGASEERRPLIEELLSMFGE